MVRNIGGRLLAILLGAGIAFLLIREVSINIECYNNILKLTQVYRGEIINYAEKIWDEGNASGFASVSIEGINDTATIGKMLSTPFKDLKDNEIKVTFSDVNLINGLKLELVYSNGSFTSYCKFNSLNFSLGLEFDFEFDESGICSYTDANYFSDLLISNIPFVVIDLFLLYILLELFKRIKKNTF